MIIENIVDNRINNIGEREIGKEKDKWWDDRNEVIMIILEDVLRNNEKDKEGGLERIDINVFIIE